jgi:hypothetical protein
MHVALAGLLRLYTDLQLLLAGVQCLPAGLSVTHTLRCPLLPQSQGVAQ